MGKRIIIIFVFIILLCNNGMSNKNIKHVFEIKQQNNDSNIKIFDGANEIILIYRNFPDSNEIILSHGERRDDTIILNSYEIKCYSYLSFENYIKDNITSKILLNQLVDTMNFNYKSDTFYLVENRILRKDQSILFDFDLKRLTSYKDDYLILPINKIIFRDSIRIENEQYFNFLFINLLNGGFQYYYQFKMNFWITEYDYSSFSYDFISKDKLVYFKKIR